VNGPRSALLLLGLAACAGAPPATGPAAPAARVRVCLVFEPPLAEPGLLLVAHEAGPLERVATLRTGVDVWLPPGPASLRLTADGMVWERPLVVGATAAEVVWHLPP
jgi:hypothetical protein